MSLHVRSKPIYTNPSDSFHAHMADIVEDRMVPMDPYGGYDDNAISGYILIGDWRISMRDILTSRSPHGSGSLSGYPRCHGESWLVHVGLRLLCCWASENHQTCSMVHWNRQVGKILSFWILNLCFTIAYIACSCELTPHDRYDRHAHLALFTRVLMIRKTYKVYQNVGNQYNIINVGNQYSTSCLGSVLNTP